jgi:nitroreductase
MQKPAITDFEVHPLIRSRWSPRSFLDRPIPAETLDRLMEAARWAPSCFNEQPWRYIVTRRDIVAPFQGMLDCLTPGNREWAGAAGALVLSVASMSFSRNGGPNRHAFHDVGLATGSLVFQATEEGLSVHQMAGFDRDRARDTFGIPDLFEPVAVIALGYRGEPDQLPDELRQRELAPRVRRPRSEFVFSGRWEEGP